jgi:hypothetical protein
MAIGVDDVLAGEDAVRDHEIAHQGGDVTHGFRWAVIRCRAWKPD